ncbi:MAG: lipopolysaccharide heptosyltransferase I [Betaproteobacteria bacterium]|nr:lipopolysaccharide heptosyltransferase I [Betaproteobacteria bacterium]
MKLLIVKTSSMGDVVHALPMASDLRRLCPDAQIDWLVEPAFAALPWLHRDVSQVHGLPWRKWRRNLHRRDTWRAMGALVDVLRERRFDLVIDAQGLLKSAWWARRVGAPVAGYDRNSIREPVASLLYTQRHEVAYTLHAVTRCRLLAAAALQPHLSPAAQVSSAVQLPAPDFGLQQVQHFEHAALRRPYAVLIPNASRPEKHWPQAHWQALGQRLQAQGLQPVVLWGSHDEQAMAQHIAQGCQGWVPPFLTVQQAAQLLAGAHLVVGLDTGFAHVAAALGRPVVGIYCDHEPGLTGITGNGPGASLGGKGQRPGFDEVLAAVQKVAQAAGLP